MLFTCHICKYLDAKVVYHFRLAGNGGHASLCEGCFPRVFGDPSNGFNRREHGRIFDLISQKFRGASRISEDEAVVISIHED